MAANAAPKSNALIQLTAQERPGPEGWVVLEIPKASLVLTRREFIAGLRRGKSWKRHQALAARVAKAAGQRGPGGDFPASPKN